MAYQARKNKKGKVVEYQELSGRSSTNLSEILSDSEESLDGFTDRSFGVPTVRFLGSQKTIEEEPEEEEKESSDTIVADQDDADSDSDDIMNFCQELEEEEARDALTGLNIDGDDLKAMMNCYKNTPRPEMEELEEEQLEEEEQEDSRSENSYGCDILKPTLIPGKNKLLGGTDSLDSCSLGSASGRSYLTSNATQEDLKHLEASSDRELLTSRTYNLDSLSQSTCSWSHAYGAAFQTSGGRSNFLPSLGLASRSSDTCSTSTYYKSLEEKKERDGLKFEAWRQRKAAQEQQKLLAAKQQREKQAREMAERAEIAKKKYDEWCRLKEEQKQREKKSKQLPVHQTSSSRSKETPEEARERVRLWERRKIEQQKQERELLFRQREAQEREEKKRLELSEAAYSKWMETIDSRPMPVPLNQGLATLRGTVSHIYINPNQWDSSTDPLSDSDDRGI